MSDLGRSFDQLLRRNGEIELYIGDTYYALEKNNGELYEYEAKLLGIDGDTFDVSIDHPLSEGYPLSIPCNTLFKREEMSCIMEDFYNSTGNDLVEKEKEDV